MGWEIAGRPMWWTKAEFIFPFLYNRKRYCCIFYGRWFWHWERHFSLLYFQLSNFVVTHFRWCLSLLFCHWQVWDVGHCWSGILVSTMHGNLLFFLLLLSCLVLIILMEMYCLKIKIPHPRYPSTRVSVQVPNLGVHFSPERHCRIMDLLAILQSTTKSSDLGASEVPQTGRASWHPADLATDARILVWRVCFYFFLIF